MNKPLGVAAFVLGAAVVAWVGAGYVGSSALALTMTVLIGALYLAGGLELRRFHRDTGDLSRALAALDARPARRGTDTAVAAPASEPAVVDPLHLGAWLGRLPPSLRDAVRHRIEGERTALPGPVMTPYLVGLLVLMGMLGTFLGMVVTLNGAVLAMESTADLPTMRAALSAPVKGLGLAFGTSVAGVAASAMLGLVSALCRRERLGAARHLDGCLTGPLRPFTLAQQRQDTLDAVQLQARAWPEVAAQMQAAMAQMARHHESMNERLLAGQDRFHQQAQAAFGALAASVDASLQRCLVDSAQVAAATLRPLVESTVAGMARETAAHQARLAGTVEQQLAAWQRAIDAQSAALVGTLDRSMAAQQAQAAAADRQRLVDWTRRLDEVAASLRQEWQRAGADARDQQDRICHTLDQTAGAIHAQAAAHARHTMAEVSRLVDAAAEAPRAAAELVASLRLKLSDSLARDDEMLDERKRIMATLATLLDAVGQAAGEQRQAVDGLVASAAAMLQQAGTQFTERLQSGSAQLAGTAAQLTGSAVELASLGEAFGAAVQQFGESSQLLTAQLQRIETALARSTARSDEQLAYYVAQAREIIDLSISSQRQIVDDLQQLAARPAPLAGEVA